MLCLNVNSDHGIVVSAAKDGVILVNSLHTASHCTAINLGFQVDKVLWRNSDATLILCVLTGTSTVYTYTLNGKFIAKKEFQGTNDVSLFGPNTDFCLATDKGLVIYNQLLSDPVQHVVFEEPVMRISQVANSKHLVCILKDTAVLVGFY